MGKELELLQKMDLTAENRQKLEALITEAKKTGKVSSKHLVETLDDVDATQDQTERFYDILEQAGIEIDVSDVLDLIGTADMDNPTLSEMQAIEDEGLPADLDEPEALPEDVENAKLDDPVRMYLKEIGKVNLLTPDEEVQLAQDMGAGDAAKEQMEELEQARREAAADARVRVEALENELAAARKQQSDLLNQHQEMDQKLKEARQARRDAMDAQKAAREELKQTREALERARKELRASGNKEITQFGVYFEACQEDFSRMMGILHKLKAGGDDEGRAKLTAAGGALLGAMEKQLAPFREEGAASC